MLKRAVCLAASLFCVAPVSAVHADEVMTDQQLLRLFPGTFQAVVRGKYEVTVVVKRDGAIVGVISGLEDHGRWTVQDGKLCIVLPNLTRGRVECSPVVAEGGWYRGRSVAFRKL